MKMRKTTDWSIEKGDYRRDHQATWTYQKKQIRKRNFKYFLVTVLYLTVIAVLALLLLS